MLLANEDGTYSQAKYIQDFDYHKGGHLNQRCLVGDVNHDGLDDIILFTGSSTETIVDILLTQEVKGKTTFTKVQQKFAFHILSSLFDYGPLAGDINGDDFDDVVSITHDGEMFILLGTADRQKKFIAVTQQYYLPIKAMLENKEHGPAFKPSQIQLYDMNDDGRADLVVIRNDGSYSITYGQQDGTFGVITDSSKYQGDSEPNIYRPNILAVRSEQHIIGINQDIDGNKALLSRNIKGEVNAHTFKLTPYSDTIVYFRLGGGNDKAIGHQEKKLQN